MRPRTYLSPKAYLQFICATRFGFLIGACVAAFAICYTLLGARYFDVVYSCAVFLPLVATFAGRPAYAKEMLKGSSSWSGVAKIGFIPILVLLCVMFSLVYALHISFGTPVTRYVQAPISLSLLFEAPFVEELVFRGWLQTRAQQLLGSAGVTLAAAIFVGFHFSLSPWLLVTTAIFTWIRFRYGSLGACVIAHYTYDLGLWAFASFVH